MLRRDAIKDFNFARDAAVAAGAGSAISKNARKLSELEA
jgi:hypothetical protein